MNELQFWHWIATGALGVLVTIIGYLYSTMAGDVKAKLSREEFKDYMETAEKIRQEFRESMVKLFQNAENHEKLDAERFRVLTGDFNGGLTRLSEKISDNHIQLLTKLNDKQDRGK